ncbi:MAG: UDP-N-acetylmuramoyl-L-alanine--D-glutamate ligase [Acidimicrobiia bacterium]|nr:UDP-N-acetylmuramoyl-L-alanine--D-glutamate ligase [Acidimicrobiia bacterium]
MKHALVLGGNVSGQSAARLLATLGMRVTVYDARPLDPSHFNDDVTFELGEWRQNVLDDIDLVVTSPGFAPASPPIGTVLERGVRLWGEIELAMRHIELPVAAITGTNGKTTVTEMTAAMLQAAGINAPAAGNIGSPLADLVGTHFDAVVLEVSSFQLFYTETFHPQVAVVLNVAPDHLDWHGTLEHYADAKARIFQQQGPGDILVFSADDQGARDLAARAGSRLVGVSGIGLPPGGAGPQADEMVLPTGTIPLRDLSRHDPVFLVDLAAAAVAAHELGAGHDAISEIGRSFVPGNHRRSLVGSWDGVAWVNDSKASNPHAAVAAIKAYASVILIAGGRNKGLDLSEVPTAGNVRHLIAIGESADELIAAAQAVPFSRAGSMRDAVAIADSIAAPGDTVLLSPGCASFDMFSSYIERGDVFAAEVRALKEAA